MGDKRNAMTTTGNRVVRKIEYGLYMIGDHPCGGYSLYEDDAGGYHLLELEEYAGALSFSGVWQKRCGP